MSTPVKTNKKQSLADLWNFYNQREQSKTNITDTEKLILLRKMIETGEMRTFVPLLPVMFNLNGRPYHLNDHFPFEPLFQTRMARRILLKAGRQVSKSTSLASRGITISAAIPDFSTLFITPLYEQIRRFSTQYVRPFLERSPVKSLLIGSNTENSVLQKSFKNFSKMFFSFAFLDAERVRGIAAHQVCLDEVQDIDYNLIPIIIETMSASRWRLQLFGGTPKTLDNTIEGLWSRSSQAEWVIVCTACKKLNIPKMGYDLEKMIGPAHDGIGPIKPSPEQIKRGIKPGVPATICAKCSHWIDPREGRWLHKDKEKRWTFPGYHIPQIIMPIHSEDPERWGELLAKQEGYNNTTTAQFYNEVLGESYDVGSRLVNKTDLEKAAILPWENNKKNFSEASSKRKNYDFCALGVDWGGGGEEEVSFTTCAVLGWLPTGHVDVIYGEKLLTPHDHMAEAKRILHIFQAFNCNIFAHDYNGAGSARETIMIQSGLEQQRVVPIVYYRSAAANIMVFKGGVEQHPRNYWQLDKARSLVLLCQAIKLGVVKFFKYDYKGEDNRGLIHDFLALTENKIATGHAEIYTIQRSPMLSDDFAHAVNFAACAIWHRMQTWPNFAELAGVRMDKSQENSAYPNTNDITPNEDYFDYS